MKGQHTKGIELEEIRAVQFQVEEIEQIDLF